jgi:hypothetical protein
VISGIILSKIGKNEFGDSKVSCSIAMTEDRFEVVH